MICVCFAALLFALTAASASAADCQFVLGFNALRNLIPEQVGECLESEHYNEIGDSVQQTTGGLMVWRKADNWTAFTDGHRTWINGPYGLESRLNTERFLWEPDYAPGGGIKAPAPTPTRVPVPTPTPAPSIDPVIADVLHIIRTSAGVTGSSIIDEYQKIKPTISFATLPAGRAGVYYGATNTIHIPERYRNGDINVTAYYLIHELGHAYVWERLGPRPATGAECIKDEYFAEALAASWWWWKYGAQGLPSPNAALDEQARLFATDKLGPRVLMRYQGICQYAA